MPTVNCPHCGREIPFELHEINTLFECAACGTKFTPGGGRFEQRVELPPGDDAPFPQLREAEDPLAQEPWFYPFLDTWTRVLVILGVLSCVLEFIFGVRFAFTAGDAALGLLGLVATLVSMALTLLFTLIAVALIPVALDTGRNVREIKRTLDRRG
jgi:hypothetical protein